jgi:hypothetical protein
LREFTAVYASAVTAVFLDSFVDVELNAAAGITFLQVIDQTLT